MMKFLSYKEWLEENPDVALEETDCEYCNGTGEDECPHCGHDMECEHCEGAGKVNDATKAYNEQRKRDEAALKKYQSVFSNAQATP